MARVELTMPNLGEALPQATIIRWTKNVGDYVKAEETVVEITTDKADAEVHAPAEGRLIERRYKAGDVVPVGELIAVFDTYISTETASFKPRPAREEKSFFEKLRAFFA